MLHGGQGTEWGKAVEEEERVGAGARGGTGGGGGGRNGTIGWKLMASVVIADETERQKKEGRKRGSRLVRNLEVFDTGRQALANLLAWSFLLREET